MISRENWKCILDKYFVIKTLYIECEETDPELKTNLQPLNEFRASLDHVMKMMCADVEKNDEELAKLQQEKLVSHLNRCFFDICDMLSINYRNKIISILEIYDVDTISKALPNYYSSIKPDIENISARIGTYRNKKGTGSDDSEMFVQYSNDVTKLREYFILINEAQPTLDEIKRKVKKEKTKSNLRSYVIGGIIGAVGSAIVAIILHFVGI